MKAGRRKGGAAIPAVIDTGRRKRSNMAQPVFKSTTGRVKGGAAQNIIEITSEDLVQNGGQYKLMGGAPIPMEMVAGRRSKQGAAQVVYPVDILGNYDPSFAGYIYKVLTSTDAYDASSLIQFLPQNELAGGVSFDHSGNDYHGAYTAVNLGQLGVPGMGMSSAGYDGATSFNNIWSAGLNADFDGTKGTVLVWAQVANVGAWTDGSARYGIQCRVDVNNRVRIWKTNVNNTLQFDYDAGGVAKSVANAAMTSVDFLPLGITWDIAPGTGEMKAFINGVQEGVTQVGLGAWAGNLSNTETVIGAGVTVPSFIWSGNTGPGLLYSEAKTPAEMLYLSTV